MKKSYDNVFVVVLVFGLMFCPFVLFVFCMVVDTFISIFLPLKHRNRYFWICVMISFFLVVYQNYEVDKLYIMSAICMLPMTFFLKFHYQSFEDFWDEKWSLESKDK